MNNLDLNLLRVLDALLAERNVTRAAARLHLSQPAISNALARLRDALGDPLLVRVGNRMVPTPYAERLAAPVGEGLRQLEQALRPETFDPAGLRGLLRIATTDYVTAVFVPALFAQLTRAAPALDLALLPADPETVGAALSDSRVDLAILGTSADAQDGLYRRRLFDERFVCVARHGHPRLPEQGAMTLDDYLGCEHLVISQRGAFEAQVDEALRPLGRRRRVRASAAHFSAALLWVERSDLLLTVGARQAACFLAGHALRAHRLPFAVPGFSAYLLWHARVHHDARHGWIREQVAATAAGLAAAGDAEPSG